MDRFTFAPPGLAEGDGAHAARARDSLLLMAQIRFGGASEAVSVRIRNLSAGGLMAELATNLERGHPAEVEVRGIGWVPGKIAWCVEGRTGIAFDQPIDPQRARKPVTVSPRGPVRAKGR